jgi:ABC-type branched-subunit amino acid transport system substrate-binding protein
MERRKFLVRTGGLATATALAGCSSNDGGGGGDSEADGDTGEDNSENVRIGVLVPFTGDFSWVGSAVTPIVEMMAERINSNGGINGRDVAMIQADTEATVDASVSATRNLIDVEEVHGIIGPTSLTFTGVTDIIQQNQVPTVSPTAGTTEMDEIGGEFIFRTVTSDSVGGRAIAKAIREKSINGQQSYERMGLIVGEAPALTPFEEPIRSSFEEFGGVVTDTINFSTGQSSYESQMASMMQSDPEIIALVASPEDASKFFRAAFNAGYEGNWFLTQEAANQSFLDDNEQQLTEGIFGIQEVADPNALEQGRLETFREDVMEFSGAEPGEFALNTYDAVNVMAAALQATAVAGDDLTRANIAPNIREVALPPGSQVTNFAEASSELSDGNEIDYAGLVGPINFDENGNIAAPFGIVQAQGGEWEQVSLLQAENI